MGELVIRLAVADDIDAIVALDRSIECLPHWAAADYRAAIAGVASEPLRCLFVAEVERGIYGFASGMLYSVADECWGELETVGVAPGMQRRGLGRKLCEAVIGCCRLRGVVHIDLEVRSRSVGPLALYRELGFEIAGSRPGYYRDPADDAVLMRLDLKPDRAEPAPTPKPAS